VQRSGDPVAHQYAMDIERLGRLSKSEISPCVSF
jgi:hypothetical protein